MTSLRAWSQRPTIVHGIPADSVHDDEMTVASRSVALISGLLLLQACSEESSSTDWWGQGGSDAATDTGDGDSGELPSDAPAEALPDAPHDAPAEAPPPDASPAPAPALYPNDRTHSPVSQWVVDRLGEILARNPDSEREVFMKAGDSISASTQFLHCFASSTIDLGTHGDLQPSIDHFTATPVQNATPFDRVSLSVESGRTAYWAMNGSPSPLTREIDALSPAVGVVMFGTNDIGWFGEDHLKTLDWYHGHLFDLVDAMIDRGVIPILSTIPPRDDQASHDAWVPTFNAVIRGMAQGRQIPLVDLHRELLMLPAHGLSSDGVHPNVFGAGACVLSSEGLTKGYNVRNLVTLTALDRVRRAVLAQEGFIDEDAPVLAGLGTLDSPYVVAGNPFVDVRDTSQSSSKALDVYDGCGSTADESGPEVVYEFELATPARIRAIVLDRGDVDIDVHLLDGSATTSGCLARNDTLIEADLSPGSYHVVLDTYVAGAAPAAGEYLFALLVCAPGDSACL